MKESPKKHKDLIMGRADVLLKFLQLISKDKPKDLDPYLENLDTDSEERPLVDQIVDMIIAGDKDLYAKYEQARLEVGSRNPYSSIEEVTKTIDYQKILGYFLTQWTTLENYLRGLFRDLEPTRAITTRYLTDDFLRQLNLPEDAVMRIYSIRQLRNQVVHGIEMPDPQELKHAGEFLENFINKIYNTREKDLLKPK